ncbi:uncharacterized protein LOC103175892 [Callorhinchus milii]|uniref:uncharacterized protein LOC103175892 n=1 Tax=Callorhinchus milii TaxID=7868 RepID=UPI001C3FD4CD|nr:uncharacterized protein LOC103175892 [Callorhinchus milii]
MKSLLNGLVPVLPFANIKASKNRRLVTISEYENYRPAVEAEESFTTNVFEPRKSRKFSNIGIEPSTSKGENLDYNCIGLLDDESSLYANDIQQEENETWPADHLTTSSEIQSTETTVPTYANLDVMSYKNRKLSITFEHEHHSSNVEEMSDSTLPWKSLQRPASDDIEAAEYANVLTVQENFLTNNHPSAIPLRQISQACSDSETHNNAARKKKKKSILVRAASSVLISPVLGGPSSSVVWINPQRTESNFPG